MNRYLTIEAYDGTVEAWTEKDNAAEILDNDEIAQWVWVYAPDKETAIKIHYQKHDEWQKDVEAGLSEKDTY